MNLPFEFGINFPFIEKAREQKLQKRLFIHKLDEKRIDANSALSSLLIDTVTVTVFVNSSNCF